MNAELPASAPTQTGQVAASDLAAGSIVANRFRIEALLGIGGMGMVYRATDLALDVPVAIKVLRAELASKPGAFERFRQELLLSRQVSSPQVVRIHDLAEHDGRWLISMDLVEGESLDKVIDRRGPLPVDESVAIARQVALGLAAAHQRDIVHRDLKPANVLIDARGDAAITDFGIARSLGASGITQTGTVVGTPDYLSPEQARGGVIDGRSDLYALGLVLYEMLAGKPAFAGSTSAESLSRRLLGPPPPISSQRDDVPTWLQRLLERMLQPQPARRLPNAAAVLAAIDSRQVPRDLRPPRQVVLGGLAVALLVVAFGGWWMWQQRGGLPVLPTFLAPDRLVIAPTAFEGLSPEEADAIRAVDHHLRQGLDAMPDLAVVDTDRTAQAVAQLGARAGQSMELDALRELVPSRDAVQLQVERVDGGWQWKLKSSGATQSAQKAATVAPGDLLASAAVAGSMLASTYAPERKFAATILPADIAALAAMGRGLADRSAGRMQAAADAFGEATAADSAYAAAWLALAETAQANGDLDQSSRAITLSGEGRGATELGALVSDSRALITGVTTAGIQSARARAAAEPDDLAAQLRLGVQLGESGDHAEANRILRSLVARDEGDARAWFLLGKNAILHGDLREAVDEYLLRALLLYRRGGDAFGQAETINALGVGYARLGQTVEATRQYREALELRRALGNRRGAASSLRNLAQLAMVRGSFAEARGQLDEARTLFSTIGDRGGLAAIDNELGLLAEEQGDYAEALAAYRRGLQSREALGDAHAIAESLNNIGFAHYQLGAYDSAQAFWGQSLDSFTRADDPGGVVRVQQNLGLLATARGKWQESQKLLDASLASAERRQMLEESAVSHRNLAELWMWRGHLKRSARAISVAKGLFAAREDRRGLADVALLQARLALLARDAPAAQHLLVGAEEAFAESSLEQRALRHLLEIELAVAEGRAEVARKSARAAADLAAKSGVLALQLQVEATRLALDRGGYDALLPRLESLGNINVRLDSLIRILRALVAAREWPAAVSLSEDIVGIIGPLDSHAFAAEAQALRAQALAATGDAMAGQSVVAARAALASLLEHASPEQRDSLQSLAAPPATQADPR